MNLNADGNGDFISNGAGNLVFRHSTRNKGYVVLLLMGVPIVAFGVYHWGEPPSQLVILFGFGLCFAYIMGVLLPYRYVVQTDERFFRWGTSKKTFVVTLNDVVRIYHSKL